MHDDTNEGGPPQTLPGVPTSGSKAIISGELEPAPSRRDPLARLCEVSRTPVREALHARA